MASVINNIRQIYQNENSNIPRKKVVDGKSKTSKTIGKKGGSGLGGRKALNDITNKSALPKEKLSTKKNLPKQEFDIPQEGFLHDHRKCIKALNMERHAFNLNLVAPGYDSMLAADLPNHEQEKAKLDSPPCSPEPLPLPEFWFTSSTDWNSPPCSPTHEDSPPLSPFTWKYEPVEFVLREDV